MAGKFIGNRRSHVYHAPGCKNAASMTPSNRVTFDTAADAEAAGYRPGKDCHP
jgi:methylphosphotriester-DNA--protein-cysteine methyltransferase